MQTFRPLESLVDFAPIAESVENFGWVIVDVTCPLEIDEARSWLKDLTEILGDGVDAHRHAVDGVVSLTDDPTVYTDAIRRPQSDNGMQSPHTDGAYSADPPELMAFFVINNAAEGGETILVDMSDLCLSSMLTRSLAEPQAISVVRGDAEATHPVFSRTDSGRVHARFSNHEYNLSGPASCGSVDGFNAVDSQLRNADCHYLVALQPNQLAVIDNTRMAHGRMAFRSSPSAPRHILRQWYSAHHDGERVINTGIYRGDAFNHLT